jgi:hypothetical protein
VDTEQLPVAIAITVVCFFAVLGLWHVGQRSGSKVAKQMAVMVGLIPVLIFGLQVASPWIDPVGRAEYRSTAVGPERREAATSTVIPIPVTNAEVGHQLELRPKIWGANAPDKPVHLAFKVRSPKGETIAEGEGDLAPTQKLRWQPMMAQFQPREEGDHTLILEIPQPVSSVDVIVREVHK